MVRLYPNEFLRAKLPMCGKCFFCRLCQWPIKNCLDKLSVLLGLRWSDENITATGNQIEDEENVIGEKFLKLKEASLC